MSTDIVPGVPWVWRETINHGGPRAETFGVVIHGTQGGASTIEREYVGTVNFCAGSNPNQVGPGWIVGAAEATRMIHDDDTNWCQTVDNAKFIGIEVCSPSLSWVYTDFQYRACADICARLSIKYGFPIRYLGRQTTPTVEVKGLIGHEDTYAGYSRGKSDPGPNWNWARLVAECQAKVDELTEPPTDPAYALVQGAELRAWLIAHPDVGKPRFRSVKDNYGEYVWCSATAAHRGGSLVVRRDWVPSWTTEHVRVMDW